ncbi:MAG TPA: xanthine dehydrogenase molybdopterin binding subunit [Casimicrobiaceae bacterium]|nr:xanthine dehydrogenase molybdopterin binding subunit [Casimicrobiaceae bacterium]
MNAPDRDLDDIPASVGAALAHDSAALHVSGEAAYTDDIPEPRGTLYAAFGVSDVAHGELVAIDVTDVASAPGVRDVITAADIPGDNNIGPILHDDPILAQREVSFVGQPLFAVAATSVEAARRAVKHARVDIKPLPAVLTIDQALAERSFLLPTVHLERGDPGRALHTAPHRLSGEVRNGGQDHFYLEGQISLAIPQEGGAMRLLVSTQHPGEVQHLVAHALGIASHDVVVECRRMGGGFGGKETQMSQFACIAAVLARRSGRPVKLRLDRDDDMRSTGKRHAFSHRYDVAFDSDGTILGLDLALASRCGFSADLSGPVNDRAVFHVDNAYWLPDVTIRSHRCRTHTVSDTAFRGFGGPQGMFAIEALIDDIARTLGKDPLDVRKANLYGTSSRNVTPYGMTVEDNVAPEIVDALEKRSGYRERRVRIAAFNRESPIVKRGIALTPVKFGIAFTATHYNQAGALINVYQDGSVLLNHGGTEMGQGLYIKVRQVVAQELGIPVASVRVSGADTSKVPNTSPTAASSGSDLNGMAALAAARVLRERLAAFAARHWNCAAADIAFLHDGNVRVGNQSIPFATLTRQAYLARVQLSATGFYATPKLAYDRDTLKGRPFLYFAYGAAVSEVAIDTLTGEHRLLAVDILHDVGRSINPAIDLGQIEGGFVQGWGWLTTEELYFDGRGELRTHAPSTYKIPTAHDLPSHFRVELFERPNAEETIHRSKAVGEPPLMLALSGFHALRDAIASIADHRRPVRLDAPATPERVLAAVDAMREAVASDADSSHPAGEMR